MKKIAIVLLEIAMIVLLGCTTDFEKGNEAFKQGDYEKAIILFEKIKEGDLNFKDSQCRQGLVYFQQKRFYKAIEMFKKINKEDPNYKEALVKMNDSFYHLGKESYDIQDWNKTLEFLNKVGRVSNEYDNAQLLLSSLGEKFYNEKNWKKALDIWSKIEINSNVYRKIEENVFNAHFQYGSELYNEKEWNSAISQLSKVKNGSNKKQIDKLIKSAEKKRNFSKIVGTWETTEGYNFPAVFHRMVIKSNKKWIEYSRCPFLEILDWHERESGRFEVVGDKFVFYKNGRNGEYKANDGEFVNGKLNIYSLEYDGKKSIFELFYTKVSQ